MNANYIHIDIPEISTGFLKEGNVVVGNYNKKSLNDVIEVTLLTMRLALRIGIKAPHYEANKSTLLPYSGDTDNIIFECPINSWLVNRQITFMRGWKQFESCIKGFNALGLMAEQVAMELKRLDTFSVDQLNETIRQFLASRKLDGQIVFSSDEIRSITNEEYIKVNKMDLAIWNCFARKTIVCSTSSNMGISLHEALRYFQQCQIQFFGKTFNLLNEDEGGLVIWCPDENADFMNHEKTAFLKGLEAETPPLTKLRTYINRIQRDPGALRDALLCGGYFFPTNPQSIDEIQNLLFFSLSQMAEERECHFEDLLKDEKVLETLRCLRCEVIDDKVYVMDGIEGGISGLALPYFLMLEEVILNQGLKAIVTWNQASIGAALAAAILADKSVRYPSSFNEKVRSEFFSLFPNISRYLDSKKIGKEIQTRIHGIFDLANLQSLAQLLGVVVERHLSGRGTAYVGLGSSSYSNGNRCYEILKDSMDNDMSFKGKTTFHPATHTINPFAQALIFAEDVYRLYQHPKFKTLDKEERIEWVKRHTRKPEHAGAAAYAGYLLSRLDTGTLSIIEIAYVLKLMGFSKHNFLNFCNLNMGDSGESKFLQESTEEGTYMGLLAKNILLMLDWPLDYIEKKMLVERNYSRLKYKLSPLDDSSVDNYNPIINIYLTGDNTFQPGSEVISHLLEQIDKNEQKLGQLMESYAQGVKNEPKYDLISFTSRFLNGVSEKLKNVDTRVQLVMKKSLNSMVERRVRKLHQTTD
jgi:hypothetical protein